MYHYYTVYDTVYIIDTPYRHHPTCTITIQCRTQYTSYKHPTDTTPGVPLQYNIGHSIHYTNTLLTPPQVYHYNTVYDTLYIIQTPYWHHPRCTITIQCTTQYTPYKHPTDTTPGVPLQYNIGHSIHYTNTLLTPPQVYHYNTVYDTLYIIQTPYWHHPRCTITIQCTTQYTLYKHPTDTTPGVPLQYSVRHIIHYTNTLLTPPQVYHYNTVYDTVYTIQTPYWHHPRCTITIQYRTQYTSYKHPTDTTPGVP